MRSWSSRSWAAGLAAGATTLDFQLSELAALLALA
jgi:hypothetical protein